MANKGIRKYYKNNNGCNKKNNGCNKNNNGCNNNGHNNNCGCKR